MRLGLLSLLHHAGLTSRRRRWLARHAGALLGVLWLLSQLLLLWKHGGPRLMTDSARYLAYATDIAERGHFAHDHNLRYVGYPLFCSLWLRIGAGPWGIVLGQMAVAGLAAAGFHQALRHLTGRPLVALAGTALLLAWPDAQNLNAYVLTDSLFTSGIILSFWALTFAQGPRRIARLLAIVLATALLRPNGFLIPAALAGAALYQWWPTLRSGQRLLLGAVGVAGAVLAWIVLNKLLLTFTIVETYLRGEIIYLYPAWVVEPTEPLQLPSPGLAPLERLGYFALHNPTYFAQLALRKAFTLFSGLKPYYSWLHLVPTVLVVYPAYWLAWRGYDRDATPPILRHFLGGFIGLQTVVVMMTIEDWDIRFLAPLLPCVFALATLGIAGMLRTQSRPPRTAAFVAPPVSGPAL